jgi:predicted metal-dependent hydrolase
MSSPHNQPIEGDAPRQLSLFDDAASSGAAAQPLPPATPSVPPHVSPEAGRDPAPAVPPGAPASPLPAPAQEPVGAGSVFRHPRGQREVMLEGHRVAFEFRRARRRSIGFVIGEEGLSVSAPRWVGVSEVEAALREKGRWIVRKLQEREERERRMARARIEWRDGASLPFLGETLIVVIDPRTTGAVLSTAMDTLPGVARLSLHVGLPQGAHPDQLREAVQSWLQRQARRIFEERCAEFAPRLGVRVKRLTLSSASTRWGSASADGSIRLNWRLVHFGLPIIDYVVAHELAHLREMNHSDAFWDVVRSVMPDFERARGHLRQEVLPKLD